MLTLGSQDLIDLLLRLPELSELTRSYLPYENSFVVSISIQYHVVFSISTTEVLTHISFALETFLSTLLLDIVVPTSSIVLQLFICTQCSIVGL